MTTTIVEALTAVMADVQAVRKGDRNETQGFNFRGIDSVVNAVGPALRTHGVLVLPTLEDIRHGTVEVGSGERRRPIAHVVVTVRYRFVGPAGDELEATVAGEAMDSGDKALPKAMSVAFRIALLQALCIPTDEPDPDTQVYERAPTRAAAPSDMIGMVLAEAARAGADEPTARAEAAQRHQGLALDELDRDQLRAEWTHWHQLAAAPPSDTAPPAAAETPGETSAGPQAATRRQLAKLNTQLVELGVTDRPRRLEIVSALVGREVPSTATLSGAEASAAIDTLDAVLANPDPVATLAAVVAQTPTEQQDPVSEES